MKIRSFFIYKYHLSVNTEAEKIVCKLGTHQGEFMGQLPSGARIEMGVMHLDCVVDDKIVEHTASADLLGLSRQIML